jgi:hypothetical protein
MERITQLLAKMVCIQADSREAGISMEEIARKTEAEREPFAAAIRAAFVPVTHTIKIEPE